MSIQHSEKKPTLLHLALGIVGTVAIIWLTHAGKSKPAPRPLIGTAPVVHGQLTTFVPPPPLVPTQPVSTGSPFHMGLTEDQKKAAWQVGWTRANNEQRNRVLKKLSP